MERIGKRNCGGLLLLFMAVGIVLSAGLLYAQESLKSKSLSLSEVVLFASQSPKLLLPERYDEKMQVCVRRYLHAIPQSSYLWRFELPSSPEEANVIRRIVLTEQMVALLGEGVRIEAEAFSQAFPLLSEWEGRSEGPMSEADYIDAWLKAHPDAKTEPFLQLLKAHRLRAGYEVARARHEEELWPILKKRYSEALMKAKRCHNPLISCLADDLDLQPYIYLEGQEKP